MNNAIKEYSDYSKLHEYFEHKPSLRDYVLFFICTSTGIPIPTLVTYTINDLESLKSDEYSSLLIHYYMKELDAKDGTAPAFTGNTNTALSYRSYDRILKEASLVCQIGKYTCTSLSRTYYYNRYISGEPLLTLSKELNHSSTTRLKNYLNITPEDEFFHLQGLIKKKEREKDGQENK